jgi:hypothetical protein
MDGCVEGWFVGIGKGWFDGETDGCEEGSALG